MADASLSFVSVTGRGVGLKMVALADNLVEISTQLPRLEADATEERCVLLKGNTMMFGAINLFR